MPAWPAAQGIESLDLPPVLRGVGDGLDFEADLPIDPAAHALLAMELSERLSVR